MDRKRLLKHLVFLMFFLFGVHLLASKFYWYYSIWYFDMPMHFLGGFLSGLLLIWVLTYKNLFHESLPKLILHIIFGVLLIGIFWEVFEFSANNYIASNLFLANRLDSISDVFFDLAGGILAILYSLKIIMLVNKNTIQ